MSGSYCIALNGAILLQRVTRSLPKAVEALMEKSKGKHDDSDC